MTYLIGLGGTGSKYVRACIDAGHSLSGALTIDNTASGDSPTNSHDVKHLQLISENDRLHEVIESGISLSMNSEASQLKLQSLASWRPDQRNLTIPLVVGSGRIRAIGRSISIAKSETLRKTLESFLIIPYSKIVIATSTDGGTGSSLVRDVIEICNTKSYMTKQIVVLLFDSLVLDDGFASCDHAANSFRTLSELTHVPWNTESESNNEITLKIVQTSGQSQIDDALQIWNPRLPITQSRQHQRCFLDNGKIVEQYSSDNTVLISSLQRSASRLFHASGKLSKLNSSLAWSLGRTRPLHDAISLDENKISEITAGWLSLSSRGCIRTVDGKVLIDASNRTYEFRLLRPTSEVPVDALPVVLETISLGILLEAEDPTTFSAINFLVQSAYDFVPSQNLLNSGEVHVESPARRLGQDLADYYGKLAASLTKINYDSPISTDEQIAYVQEQFSLAQQFALEPYDGSECVLQSGQVIPDTTLFRDISKTYIDECKKFIDRAAETTQRKDQFISSAPPSLKSTSRKARRSSRRIYAKPGMWIRLGVPAALAVISIIGTITFLSSSHLRNVWSETATAVGGIMGSVAVCLGAVALIWSIQNSSVETARTDRLFTACLGIQEMTLMMRIALQNAHATNDSKMVGRDLWDHQSLHLAAYLLGQRITEALDSGLFGLLASIDEDNEVSPDMPMSSASRRVFVLLDDLVRVAPEIISDKDLEIIEKPADPERVLELAEQLRNAIEPITYRYMANTLRRTPASVY